MPSDSQAAADALYTANQIVNTFHLEDPRFGFNSTLILLLLNLLSYECSSILEARKIAADYFKSRKYDGVRDHSIIATGHCHIDTGNIRTIRCLNMHNFFFE